MNKRVSRSHLIKVLKNISKTIIYIPVFLFNSQTKDQSKKDISSHYDIGNDLYKLMLDRSMNYSCAYWPKNISLNSSDGNNNLELQNTNTFCKTLDEAQFNKMLLIAKKLHLKPGMKVLDIGCGWGYLAKFLAINFDVQVIGITISEEQFNYATSNDLKPNDLEFLRISELEKSKINGNFEFRLMDYRDVDETFDRIVSVGMIEHVGSNNYDEFFTIVERCLDDNGLFLLHTIGIGFHQILNVDPWIRKNIFPNGMIPYHSQIFNATLGKFLIEDWHNFGMDYYRTLCAWKDNFEKNWFQLKHKYDERFKRIWTFYLCYCAASFKSRKIQLIQVVFSKKGFKNG